MRTSWRILGILLALACLLGSAYLAWLWQQPSPPPTEPIPRILLTE